MRSSSTVSVDQLATKSLDTNFVATVNELSNTIDLESTLIKAEALFRRFQRVVEAVDKKGNFPAPRRTISDQGSSSTSAPVNEASDSSPNDRPDNHRSASATNSNTAKDNAKGKGKATEEPASKVITPELRKLLSRNVEVLPRDTVAQKGDGMPTR
jgi:TBC1 domain family member 15